MNEQELGGCLKGAAPAPGPLALPHGPGHGPTCAARPAGVGEEAEPLLQLQGFQGLLGHSLLHGRAPGAQVCSREDSQRGGGPSPVPAAHPLLSTSQLPQHCQGRVGLGPVATPRESPWELQLLPMPAPQLPDTKLRAPKPPSSRSPAIILCPGPKDSPPDHQQMSRAPKRAAPAGGQDTGTPSCCW